MACWKTLAVTLSLLITAPLSAQSAARPNPLDDRGGLPVPQNLQDLKNLSLDFWLKFRQTNQRLYDYVNEAAEFHAYQFVCKRHDLNVQMGPVTKLAQKYLQATIPAHYDEPEFALLEKLTKTAQQDFLDDMSSDVYAFEFGMRVAQLRAKTRDSGKTKKVYCADIRKNYQDSYIALLATAKRNLNDSDS